MNFPKWQYHKELCPDGKIIRSNEEFEKLGKGWVDSPALFDVKSVKDETPVGSVSMNGVESVPELADQPVEAPASEAPAKSKKPRA